jgi:hypothetical protein
LRTLKICLVLMEDGISPDCSLNNCASHSRYFQ